MNDVVLEHFQLRRHPFTPEIDVEGFYNFESFSQGLLRLQHILHNRGTVLVVGEPGSGKTSLVRSFVKKLAPSAFLVHDQVVPPVLNPIKSVVEGLLTGLGEAIPFNNPARALSRLKSSILALYKKNQMPVILLDDVHHLNLTSWLTLKTLMNYELDSKVPLVMVFIGARQETLRQLNFSALQEVRDRLSFCYHMQGLKACEVEAYLAKRMEWAGAKHPVFPTAIAEQMCRHSQGLPRRLNRLSSGCLLAAATLKRSLIDQDCLDQATSETNFQAQREEE